MDQKRVKELARKSAKSPEKYCLDKISEWESVLSNFRDDYRGLDEEELQERIEDWGPVRWRLVSIVAESHRVS